MMQLLFSPLSWALLLALLLALGWRSLQRIGRTATALLLFVSLVLCAPVGANLLVRWVESRITTHDLCQPRTADSREIVVLSGGLEHEPDTVDDYGALTSASWQRLLGAIRLWRGSQGAMVVSGGGPYAIKEADVLARLAVDWGIPASVLRTETHSSTTWESAFALRAQLHGQVRLVSSALHLPRALVALRAAGIDACVVPSDSQYNGPGGIGYLLPQASAIDKAQRALHELAGTLAYRIRAHRLRQAVTQDSAHR